MKTYNLEQLVSITYGVGGSVNKQYTYYPHIPEWKLFGFIVWREEQKAGLYDNFDYHSRVLTDQQIEEIKKNNFISEDNVVTWKPFVRMIYSNNERKDVHFDSIDEVEQEYEVICSQLNLPYECK